MLVRRTTILALLLLASAAPAQDAFSELWKKHSSGEDVGHELVALSQSKQASAKERFNASYLLAVIALGRGKGQDALGHLEAAEKARPGTPQVMVRRAEARLIEGDTAKAGKQLEAAARVIGRKKSAIRMRCEILRARLDGKTGHAKRGAQRLKKLAAKHKKSWEVFFFLGHLHESMDDPREAVEAYRKAIDNLPETDPVPGVYAYQRWAALSVSSQKGSYGNPKLLKEAVACYQKFLARAAANHVPQKLVAQVRQAVQTLEYFNQGR